MLRRKLLLEKTPAHLIFLSFAILPWAALLSIAPAPAAALVVEEVHQTMEFILYTASVARSFHSLFPADRR